MHVHGTRLRFALAALSLILAPPAGLGQEPAPDPAEVMRRVHDAARSDYELRSTFSYVEQRRDVKISRLGKVTVGPLRTFEVYPSHESGETYKRLIAIDGEPLEPAELARRDLEHQANLLEEAERRKRETPQEREAREAPGARKRREREAALADALAVYEATFVGRERLFGERVLVLDLRPRPEARVATREGRWMKHFGGRLWVDEDDYQIAKLDLRAIEDLTIGWGIIGRIHAGSRLALTRRKFEGVWLPAELVFEGSGRTLLFRKFEIDTVTRYSGYKRASR